MATYTIYSPATGEGYVMSSNATYSTARSSGTLFASTSDDNYFGQKYEGSTYYCVEGFVSFNTSSVAGSVESVKLSFVVASMGQVATNFTAYARAKDWGTSMTTADWIAGASLSGNPLRASSDTSTWSNNALIDFTSDSSFASNVANPVRLVLSSNRLEAGTTPTGLEVAQLNGGIASGTTNDPRLTIVTYDPPVLANMAPRIPAEGQG